MLLLIVSLFLATIPKFGPGGEAVASHQTSKRITMQIWQSNNYGGCYFQRVADEKANHFINSTQSNRKHIKRSYRRTNQAQQTELENILTDQSLWGKDFPSVLGALPAFTQAGEQQVSVFPDRVIGRTKYTRRAQAAAKLPRLAQGLRASPRLRSLSPKVGSYMTQGRGSLTVQTYEFPDDRTFRISAGRSSAQFLAPGLSIADVKKRLGKEEKITTEVLDDGTERRPVILTLYHYAGGAVIFAESDVNPNIGSVDRVFLDAQRISTTLF